MGLAAYDKEFFLLNNILKKKILINKIKNSVFILFSDFVPNDKLTWIRNLIDYVLVLIPSLKKTDFVLPSFFLNIIWFCFKWWTWLNKKFNLLDYGKGLKNVLNNNCPH